MEGEEADDKDTMSLPRKSIYHPEPVIFICPITLADP